MSEELAVPIAVTGLGAIAPGARNAAEFWRMVLTGRDQITDVPAGHWLVEDYYDPDPSAPDRTYCRRGAFLPDVEFDPLRYGVPPNDLAATDTSQLLAQLVAEQALGDLAGVDRERVSVILGAGSLELLAEMYARLQRPVWLKALRECGVAEPLAQRVCDKIAEHYVPWQEMTFPRLSGNVVAGRIANKFDLHGASHTADAACASSFAALSNATAELALGRADLVLTGGVDTLNDIGMFTCFSKTPALSPTGDCRPFAEDADGTMLGEGVIMLALRRLADAERDGDPIYAVIRGVGGSSDGAGTVIHAPVPEGQARALRRAYQQAGYPPDTVELLEAHGTATTAGDRAEFAALREVFAATGRTDPGWCALGSVKSQIGHTKFAAGAAGLAKAVLAVRHGVLPPTIKVDRPNPELDLPSSPFYLNTEARPWVSAGGHPRRAGVSSFGFGGSNFHVTVEEYLPGRGRLVGRLDPAPSELLLFGAASERELATLLGAVDVARPLAELARQSQERYDPEQPVRLAVVASDGPDLAAKLAGAADGAPVPGCFRADGPADPGRVAFLFPGQGAQYLGMGADLAMRVPAALRVWDRFGGPSRGDATAVHRVVFPPPAFDEADRAEQRARLAATEWAQPALAVQSMALLAALAELGVRADCAAGHSFGELIALHHAGALDAETLVQLARRRGELIRDAARERGSMAAITAPLEEVRAAIADEPGVWLANHNAPEQVVVSGAVDAVARLVAGFTARGLSATVLDTDTAFHSPLVAAATEPFAEYLAGLPVAAPAIEVYGNADATRYPDEPETIRLRLADHLAAPVRFAEQVEAMYGAGVRTFVEVGAGATLTGLVGRILGDREHAAVCLDRQGRNGVTALQEGIGQLAVRGFALDLSAWWADRAPQAPESPAPALTVTINGANYGRPYPPPGGTAALPPPNPEPAPEAPDPGWLGIIEQAGRRTAEAHELFQRRLTESHLAFLKVAETSFATLLRSPSPALPLNEPHVAVSTTVSRASEHTESAIPAPAEPADTAAALTVATGEAGQAPPPAPAEPLDPAEPALARRVVRAVPSEAPGTPLPGLDTPGILLVTDDGEGVAQALADRLTARGLRCLVGREPPSDLAGVIVLDGLCPVDGPEMAIEAQRDAFRLARAVAARLEERGGVFVTVQGTGGDFGLAGAAPERAWLGGLAGLARTARREWPTDSAKAIDCALGHPPERIADAIADELFTGGDMPDIGLLGPSGRVRLELVAEPAPVADHAAAPGVLVVTGGARGVTASALLDLVRRAPGRIVLLGRTDPEITRTPAQLSGEAARITAARQVRATLDELSRLGAKARYLRVDVRDQDAVAAALAEVRAEWGPITGIVHGAGMLADRRIVEKTDEQFSSVFDTKVDGLRSLLAATSADPLELVCLFSSVASVFGNAGQVDYAMANETLNLVASAERARRPGCVVRSIAWGPWQGGMVAKEMAARFRRRGIALIPPEQGAAACSAELLGAPGPDRVVLMAGKDF